MQFIFNNIETELLLLQLHPWSSLIQEQAGGGANKEEEEEDFEDIIIPVPYDPRIPGLRCEDIEDKADTEDEIEISQLWPIKLILLSNWELHLW